MGPSALPTPTTPTPDDCCCPKLYLVPAFPCDEDTDKQNVVVEVNFSSSAPINKPIVWVMGGPGSGKGTLCELIISKYGFTHLSTGELLRAEVESGSERSKYLTDIMDEGALVSNEVVLCLLKETIQTMAPNTNGFLIDGYPREKSQAIAFEEAIAPPSAILYFEASEDTLLRRLQERSVTSTRTDDNEITIKLRLKTFLENKQELLDQYTGNISWIDAETSMDAIFAQVEKVLDPIVADYLDGTNQHFIRSVNNLPVVSVQQKP